MYSVEGRTWRNMSVLAGALVSPQVVNAAVAGASQESSSVLFANDWTYVVTALGVILLVGAVLAVVRSRRAPSPIAANRSFLGADAPRHEDTNALRRERKEELAATAGMLGELLDQYLTSRFYHLLLIYPDVPSLQRRLNEVEEEYAAISFFYFCKLVSLLAECESQGGAMPLLSDQAVQDAAQRLINVFLASIPQGKEEEEGSIDTFDIAAKFNKHCLDLKKRIEFQSGTPVSQVGDFVRKVNPQRFVIEGYSRAEGNEFLGKEFIAYQNWLKLARPELIVAAEALRTFYTLISQDLRGTGGQFKQKQFFSSFATGDPSALHELLDNLTPVGLATVLSESRLPRPIGVFLRRGPPPREPEELSQPIKEEPQKLPEKTPEGSSSGGVTQIQADTVIIQK